MLTGQQTYFRLGETKGHEEMARQFGDKNKTQGSRIYTPTLMG